MTFHQLILFSTLDLTLLLTFMSSSFTLLAHFSQNLVDFTRPTMQYFCTFCHCLFCNSCTTSPWSLNSKEKESTSKSWSLHQQLYLTSCSTITTRSSSLMFEFILICLVTRLGKENFWNSLPTSLITRKTSQYITNNWL